MAGPHHKIRAKESGPFFIIVLDAVSRHVLSGDDVRSVVRISGECQAAHPIALSRDRFSELAEQEYQVMHSEVVCQVHESPAPPDDENRVVLTVEVVADSVERAEVGFLLSKEVYGTLIRAIEHQLSKADRALQAVAGLDCAYYIGHLVAHDGST